jgi:hypothetical protein
MQRYSLDRLEMVSIPCWRWISDHLLWGLAKMGLMNTGEGEVHCWRHFTPFFWRKTVRKIKRDNALLMCAVEECEKICVVCTEENVHLHQRVREVEERNLFLRHRVDSLENMQTGGE